MRPEPAESRTIAALLLSESIAPRWLVSTLATLGGITLVLSRRKAR